MFRIVRAPVVLRDGIGRRWGVRLTCLAALIGGCRDGQRQKATGTRTETAAPLPLQVEANYGGRHLSFEPNRGQVDARVNFLARGDGYSLFLEPTRAMFSLSTWPRRRARTDVTQSLAARLRDLAPNPRSNTNVEMSTLGMRLIGANAAAAVVGESPLPGKVNYYIGNDPTRWHENIPTFGRVRHSNVYPGIDLVYYGTQGQLEYDFIVAPGADPGQIRVAFDGARPKLDAKGDIVLARGNAEIHLRNLIVYQQKAAGRESVAGRFVLSSEHQMRFAVADYDRSRALVIDPTVIYSTYLAGSAENEIWGLAVDSTGSAVAVGETTSTDFPVTSGAYQATNPYPGFNGSAVITKLSPDGSSLAFSTYLGGHLAAEGDSSSWAYGVAVDPQNNIYVGGETQTAGFPTTAGAFQPAIAPGASQPDGFVTKLTATGTLAYSTYLGGAGLDYVYAIAVDSAGDAYVTGNTLSQVSIDTLGNPVPTPRFPTTSNAYQRPFASPVDPGTGNRVSPSDVEPFFTELDPTGSNLLYSTLLAPETCVDLCSDGSTCLAQETCVTGGCAVYCGGKDYSFSVAIGKGGVGYIGGAIGNPNFPTTAGAFQTVAHPGLNALGAGGGFTGFIAAFDPTKSGAASLVYSTFLGGKKFHTAENIAGIAADPDGNVYATGATSSPDFPITAGSYATACTTDPSVDHCPSTSFVTKLDPTSKMIYSTFLTDSAANVHYDGYQIALDSARNAYVLGNDSGGGSFPLINPVSTTGCCSIQTLGADGSRMLFSTIFYGGTNNPSSTNGAGHNGFVVDKSGNIYVASTNTNHDLATTPGAFQTNLPPAAARTGYVVKISPIGGAAGASGVGGAAGGGGGTGGASGAAGSNAGAGGRGGSAGTGPSDAGTDAPGSNPKSSGCGCSVPSKDPPTWGVCLLVLLVTLARRSPRTRLARDVGVSASRVHRLAESGDRTVGLGLH